jgi:ArsR family transcriptional regulator, arsenate/arsenite/antimonite-responsive transcriptional repressor
MGLRWSLYFDKYRNMEKEAVITALAALAQETRLDVFRCLVQAGPSGLPAGGLAKELEVPPATLSFHLKELRNAQLVTGDRQGRSIRYAPNFDVIGAVVGYLGENCCRDTSCCETSFELGFGTQEGEI